MSIGMSKKNINHHYTQNKIPVQKNTIKSHSRNSSIEKDNKHAVSDSLVQKDSIDKIASKMSMLINLRVEAYKINQEILEQEACIKNLLTRLDPHIAKIIQAQMSFHNDDHQEKTVGDKIVQTSKIFNTNDFNTDKNKLPQKHSLKNTSKVLQNVQRAISLDNKNANKTNNNGDQDDAMIGIHDISPQIIPTLVSSEYNSSIDSFTKIAGKQRLVTLDEFDSYDSITKLNTMNTDEAQPQNRYIKKYQPMNPGSINIRYNNTHHDLYAKYGEKRGGLSVIQEESKSSIEMPKDFLGNDVGKTIDYD